MLCIHMYTAKVRLQRGGGGKGRKQEGGRMGEKEVGRAEAIAVCVYVCVAERW